MPHYVIERTVVALNEHRIALNGSNILIIGLAYKPDVDDLRESPTFKLIDGLRELSAQVSYYDPFIPKIHATREHASCTGMESVSWDKDTISAFDAVIISTNHSDINYRKLADWNEIIIDTRNAMKNVQPQSDKHIWKA